MSAPNLKSDIEDHSTERAWDAVQTASDVVRGDRPSPDDEDDGGVPIEDRANAATTESDPGA